MRELKGQVRRYLRLVELGALEIDVTVLPPARRRALETLGRRMTAQQIRRLEPRGGIRSCWCCCTRW